MGENSMEKVEQRSEESNNESIQEGPVLGQSFRDGIMASYSSKELEEARAAAAKVVACAKAVGESIYNLVIAAIEFRDRRFYERLSFNNFDEWYANEGFVPSALKKYMFVYDKLTIEFGIEVEQYQNIDIAKTYGILNLIKAGVTATEMEKSLDIADDMLLEDWIRWSEEAVEDKKAGVDVGTPRDVRLRSSNTGRWEGVEPGYYLLVKVPTADIGLASPETNGNLKKLKGLRGGYLY